MLKLYNSDEYFRRAFIEYYRHSLNMVQDEIINIFNYGQQTVELREIKPKLISESLLDTLGFEEISKNVWIKDLVKVSNGFVTNGVDKEISTLTNVVKMLKDQLPTVKTRGFARKA